MKAAPAAAMIGMQGVKAVIELEQPGSKIESEGSHWWAAQLYWQPAPALSIISNHVPRDPAVPGYSWLDYSMLRDIGVDRHVAVYKRVYIVWAQHAATPEQNSPLGSQLNHPWIDSSGALCTP